jgi:hypothetical protein
MGGLVKNWIMKRVSKQASGKSQKSHERQIPFSFHHVLFALALLPPTELSNFRPTSVK